MVIKEKAKELAGKVKLGAKKAGEKIKESYHRNKDKEITKKTSSAVVGGAVLGAMAGNAIAKALGISKAKMIAKYGSVGAAAAALAAYEKQKKTEDRLDKNMVAVERNKKEKAAKKGKE